MKKATKKLTKQQVEAIDAAIGSLANAQDAMPIGSVLRTRTRAAMQACADLPGFGTFDVVAWLTNVEKIAAREAM